MIQLASLSKSFGDRVLLDQVSWQIDDRERVGLAGPNGAGKTTLLKMLAGLEEPDSGSVVKPSGLIVGYLPQDGLSHSGRTLIEEAGLAFKPLLDMRAQIQSIEERLGDDAIDDAEHEVMLTQYSELQENFRRLEGYSIDLKITTVLRGLGFSPEDFDKPSETFSGGWQMRIALAKLLLTRPGLLLLDEPTNHLDLEARNWLEEYLSDYPHAVILVSHDRFFLDAVVTRITDIGLRKLTDYTGNYSDYLVEREARMERLRQQKRDQDDEIERMQAFINRFRYQATKAAQVQSRIKMMDKIVPIEIPPERKRVHFTFPKCAKSGRTVLELQNVRKAYGDRVVFEHVNVHIERGDRIALIGVNGAGKSTMMRMLSGVESPDQGTRTEGHQVITQYFAQDEATRLDPTLTVYQTLAGDAPIHMVPHIRNILGGFLFSGDDVDKPVRVLSGGERTRLAVARMLLRPANTLLLDEPTNHLDLDSKDVLLEALEDFGGTLIFVSHDRYFVDKLATKVISIGHGDALLYPGNYEEFLWSQKDRGAKGAMGAGGARGAKGATGATGAKGAMGAGGARGAKGATGATGAKGAMGAGGAMGAKGATGAKGAMVERSTPAVELDEAPRPEALRPADVGVKADRKTTPVQPALEEAAGPRLVRRDGSRQAPVSSETAAATPTAISYEEKKRLESEARKARKVVEARQKRIDDLESRIAEREQAIRDIEATMSAPGFYENHEEAKPIIDKHQALMWEVGDLMHQWEELQRTDL